ncbi:hypothetical protein D3C87_1393520 [compost metagenome]
MSSDKNILPRQMHLHFHALGFRLQLHDLQSPDHHVFQGDVTFLIDMWISGEAQKILHNFFAALNAGFHF